jgi:phage terminase large subunit GpA-like protein
MRRAATAAEPPEPKPLAEWVGENLVLSSEDSAEPGRYTFDRAPYQRGIFEAIGDPRSARRARGVESGRQDAGREGTIGYHIDQDPCPILFVTYSLDMAQTFSQDRLRYDGSRHGVPQGDACTKRRRATPAIRRFTRSFPAATSRWSARTPRRPLIVSADPLIVLDEVDRYPPSAGKEGDPVRLAIARGKTFWNRKELLISSPTDAETSRIHPEYLKSDQRGSTCRVRTAGTCKRCAGRR